jgi:hypothetical protein
MGKKGIFLASWLPSEAALPGIRFHKDITSSHKNGAVGSDDSSACPKGLHALTHLWLPRLLCYFSHKTILK